MIWPPGKAHGHEAGYRHSAEVAEAEQQLRQLAGIEAEALMKQAIETATEEAQTQAYPPTYLQRLRAEIEGWRQTKMHGRAASE